MTKLTDREYVVGLKSNLRATLEGPAGKEVMDFLEQACGWYESIFDPTNRDLTLINAGRRQVLATLKTLIKLDADQIVYMAKQKEGEGHGM